MKEQIKEYEDLHGIELQSEAIKAYMMEMNQNFIEYDEYITFHLERISNEYKKNESMLNNSMTWKSIEKYEDMIAHQCRVVFELRQDISLRRQQTEYESAKNDCFRALEELNVLRS